MNLDKRALFSDTVMMRQAGKRYNSSARILGGGN
jgi:hypothetical protein